VKQASSKADCDELGEEVFRLREEKQRLQLESAGKDELRNRMAEMSAFLREQPTEITEFSEQLVRRLIEKVTVYEDEFAVGFRSGMSVVVDEDD
jgi:site-specific DNA recombinase